MKIALGVLFGYPLGGFLYDFVSESAPFILISAFLFTDLAFQLSFFDLLNNEVSENDEKKRKRCLGRLRVLNSIPPQVGLETTSLHNRCTALPIELLRN